MSTLVEKLKVKPSIKSKFDGEFQHYLKKQCLKTTFNGLELETFSWYKKMLGLMQSQIFWVLIKILNPGESAVHLQTRWGVLTVFF